MGEAETVLLSFLVERTLGIDGGIGAAGAGAGVAEKEEIHQTVTIVNDG